MSDATHSDWTFDPALVTEADDFTHMTELYTTDPVVLAHHYLAAVERTESARALLRDWLDAQGDEEFAALADATHAFLGARDQREGR